jgi:hypothetical protein
MVLTWDRTYRHVTDKLIYLQMRMRRTVPPLMTPDSARTVLLPCSSCLSWVWNLVYSEGGSTLRVYREHSVEKSYLERKENYIVRNFKISPYTRVYPKVSGLSHNERNNNNKHSLMSNIKGYGGKTHYTDSQNRDTTASRGRELYHLQFSLQAASPKTFGYTLVLLASPRPNMSSWRGA